MAVCHNSYCPLVWQIVPHPHKKLGGALLHFKIGLSMVCLSIIAHDKEYAAGRVVTVVTCLGKSEIALSSKKVATRNHVPSTTRLDHISWC
jgi:hypothetical protein